MKNRKMKGAAVFAAPFVVLFLLCVSLLPAQASQNNDLTFDLSRWDRNLLNIVERGPFLLSRDANISVPPYPANDSEQTQAELRALQDLIPARDVDTELRILNENTLPFLDVISNEGLFADQNYKTAMLLEQVNLDLQYFIMKWKKHYARVRPSDLNEKLSVSIAMPSHPSYPSGHASQSYMVGLVLSDFDPENAQRYMDFAQDIGHRREIAGVHFSSDTKAGQKLAVDVLAALRNIAAFEKKYQDAKASYVKPQLKITELNQKED